MAVAPVWVSDVGVWAGAFVALASLFGIVWALLRRARKLLVDEVTEIVDERVAPLNDKLDALHDCTEGLKSDLSDAKAVAEDINGKLVEHMEADREALDELKDGQRDLHDLIDGSGEGDR